jgi:transcriptional regulator with XRE-family HTH domain
MVTAGERRQRSAVSDRSGPADPRLRQFGAALRIRREAAGLTLEQLAERAQVGTRQLARVEAGRASPSLIWLYDVSDALNVSLTELIVVSH